MRSPGALPLVATLILAVLGSACTSSRRAREGHRGFEQSGIASWYGPGFDGRTTANGETYDMETMTAAHKQLPFGTVVEVKNRDNGRRTRVRINDRGPFVAGRIIDLSKAAAREIGMLGPGTARVRLRVVGRNPAPAIYAVQAGAFRDRQRAESRLAAVRSHYRDARIESSKGLHRVILAGLSRRSAEEVVRNLERNGIESVVMR
ncbi:MAG: septal ring lytic transglycosylase RlpA family protein [bacterium]|nr:septal ring lytic transglycosylase RlpA family protein [bacterium]